MFGVSMDSLGPTDQRLMDTFWIQIIQIKISGKYLDHKNHIYGLIWLPFDPWLTPDGYFLDPDHPDKKIWKKSGKNLDCKKLHFWLIWLAFDPWLIPDGYFLDPDHPDQNIWKKSG